MKFRQALAGAVIVATLALGGCGKSETATNTTANASNASDDTLADVNDAASVTENSSNGGDPMKGDLTHP